MSGGIITEQAIAQIYLLHQTALKTCNMREGWWRALEHSHGTRPSLSHICSGYRYFKYKGMITGVRCFIWLALIWRREDKTQELLCGLDLETECREFKETDRYIDLDPEF